MPGLSVHVVDVTRGVPAQGMAVAIHALSPERRLLAQGLLSASGVLDHPIKGEVLPVGVYEVVFQAGAFFAAAGVTQSDPPFLGEVPFRFSVADPEQHLHLPLKITPWGFSIYRGA